MPFLENIKAQKGHIRTEQLRSTMIPGERIKGKTKEKQKKWKRGKFRRQIGRF
jgi:hypothetical protein